MVKYLLGLVSPLLAQRTGQALLATHQPGSKALGLVSEHAKQS